MYPAVVDNQNMGVGTVGDTTPSRNRARDTGSVFPLGVEVSEEFKKPLERFRADKKWSKRTVVEEALRMLFTAEGYMTAKKKKE